MPDNRGEYINILLVEDDPGDQELTKRAFDEGKVKNRIFVVENGEEALDYLNRRGAYTDPEKAPWPHLILLDLNMPKLDGKEVLAAMRADPKLKRIPVIALTTSKQEEDILRSYDLGVNSYITKPVDMDQFVKVIRALESYWFEVVVLPPAGG